MDLRDAYFKSLYDRVSQDKRVIVLTADHGALWLTKIQKDFPKQYLNVGIQEQNMVNVAHGLALCGKLPVCYTINAFFMRAYEQITHVCKAKLPVTFVGVGAGYTYSTDGPTHHGVTDFGPMLQLMRVWNCTDEEISQQAAFEDGPIYVRIGRGNEGPIAELIVDGVKTVLNKFPITKLPKGNLIVREDNLNGPVAAHVAQLGIQSICPREFISEYGTREFLNQKAGICL